MNIVTGMTWKWYVILVTSPYQNGHVHVSYYLYFVSVHNLYFSLLLSNYLFNGEETWQASSLDCVLQKLCFLFNGQGCQWQTKYSVRLKIQIFSSQKLLSQMIVSNFYSQSDYAALTNWWIMKLKWFGRNVKETALLPQRKV